MKFCLVFSVVLLAWVAESQEPTSLNNPHILEFYKKHPRADSNKDGVLNRAEMRAYIGKWVPQRMTSKIYPPLKLALKRSPWADLNRDGVLTRDELLTYLR